MLIAYDRDDAGDRAAAKLAERLQAEGIECFRVLFPAGMDANALITGVDDPAGALAELLRSAAWLGSGQAPRRIPVPVEPGPAPDLARAAPQSTAGSPADDVEALSSDPDEQHASFPTAQPLSSPVPAGPPVGPGVRLEGEELRVQIDDRRWRVRGLAKVTSFEVLRVNVLVAREDERRGHLFHVDTLDLYSARARGVFCRQAAGELGVAEELVARDLGRVLMVCEERAEEAIRQAQAPADPAVVLSDAERERALELLRAPDLVERIVRDFAAGRGGGRAGQLPGGLSGCDLAQAGSAAGGDRAVDLGRGEVGAAGRGARLRARGGAGVVLGDDRPELVLHGRVGPGSQGAGGLRGGGRRARRLRAQAAAIGGGAVDRLHRQGRHLGPAGDPHLPREGAGGDLPDHHGGRRGRGAPEPLHRSVSGRGQGADPCDPRPPARARDLEGPASPSASAGRC